MIKITTLLENSTVRHNLLSQHGQSLLIELDDQKILFDVGEVYEGLIYNLNAFKLAIEDIDQIVISHRHIDHIGSLDKLLPQLKTQKLILPTQLGEADNKAAGPKYIFLGESESGEYNLAANQSLTQRLLAYPHHQIANRAFEILPNLWTTGCVGEKMEEQALVYDQKELGLTLMVGCSHPGLEIFVETAKRITGNSKIRAIVGGFHFNPLTDTEVEAQAKYLDSLNLECLMPNHCTGIRQTEILRANLPDKVKISKTYSVGTGNSLTIDHQLSFDLV